MTRSMISSVAPRSANGPADARAKYSFQSEPFQTEGDADRPVITAHVTGDFPGSPVDLTYRFVVIDGAIAALSIG